MKFALLKNFGKKSTSSNLISQDELLGDSTSSLFIFGSMRPPEVIPTEGERSFRHG
jgi:hypothetical protein